MVTMIRISLTSRTHRRSFSLFSRLLNNKENDPRIDKENLMKEKLKSNFPNAKTIEIVDISGGCGAMYEVTIDSSDFKGLSIVKQHRLVNEALKDEIKEMHGLRIHTSVP